MSLFRPSGGLVYHWRALQNGWRWRTFRRDVAQWLDVWDCSKEHLLLIGPSGGHTLPTLWLRQFKKIDAYDLDPLARFFFQLRHRHSHISFHQRDMFWREGRLSLAPIQEVLHENPQASILFCNVLGQVLLENAAEESDWYQFLKDLRQLLSGRSWASYHDMYSKEVGQAEVDHLTNGSWLDGLIQLHFDWPLSRRNHHSTGAVSVVAPLGGPDGALNGLIGGAGSGAKADPLAAGAGEGGADGVEGA